MYGLCNLIIDVLLGFCIFFTKREIRTPSWQQATHCPAQVTGHQEAACHADSKQKAVSREQKQKQADEMRWRVRGIGTEAKLHRESRRTMLVSTV